MISSRDFKVLLPLDGYGLQPPVEPGGAPAGWVAGRDVNEGRSAVRHWADLLPPVGSYLTATGQFLMAADIAGGVPRRLQRVLGLLDPGVRLTQEHLPAPHRPPSSLPNGSTAVYVFSLSTTYGATCPRGRAGCSRWQGRCQQHRQVLLPALPSPLCRLEPRQEPARRTGSLALPRHRAPGGDGRQGVDVPAPRAGPHLHRRSART